MAVIYTMDQIIAECDNLGLHRVAGNIIFPSNPTNRVIPENSRTKTRDQTMRELLDTANSAGFYARKIGLVHPNSWSKGRDLELDSHHELGLGECFIEFETFERFKEVMELFKTVGQAFPYFLLCNPPSGGIQVRFNAQDKANFLDYTYAADEHTLDYYRTEYNHHS